MSTPSTWQTIRTLLTPRRIVMLGIAGVLFLAVLWWIRQFIDLTPQGLRTLMAPFGWWGGLLLSGIIALRLVVPIAPATIAQVGAGLLYGPWVGFGITMLGDVVGSLLGFAIARQWGRRTFLYTRLSDAEKAAIFTFADQVLALDLGRELIAPDLPAELARLLADREVARAAKNWSESDRLRVELESAGLIINDTAAGQEWEMR